MGVLLALASSGLWGTADFLAGEMSRRRAAVAVAGASQVVGLGVMLVVMLATGAHTQGVAWSQVLPWAVLASLTGLAGLVSFYQALSMGRMGIVSPIAALGVLVPLAVGLLRGEEPAAWQYLGIVVAVIGVVLASGPEVSGGAGLRPVMLAVLAAVCFGSFAVFVAEGSQTSAVLTMTAQRATSASLVLILALTVRRVGGLQTGDAPRLLLIGVFDVFANLTYGLASTMGLLSVVSVLGSLYPVVTVVLAWLILKERLQAAQYVGVTLALVGVVLISAG